MGPCHGAAREEKKGQHGPGAGRAAAPPAQEGCAGVTLPQADLEAAGPLGQEGRESGRQGPGWRSKVGLREVPHPPEDVSAGKEAGLQGDLCP